MQMYQMPSYPRHATVSNREALASRSATAIAPKPLSPNPARPEPGSPPHTGPGHFGSGKPMLVQRLPRPVSPDPMDLPRDVASRFGRRFRQLRQQHGWTQVEVAVHFGIDRTFLSDVERGRKSVCLPTLEVMALGFGLSLSDLMRGV